MSKEWHLKKQLLFEESKETEEVIFPEDCLKFESFSKWMNKENHVRYSSEARKKEEIRSVF